MTQSARVALDAHGNVVPTAEQTPGTHAAAGEDPAKKPCATKERP